MNKILAIFIGVHLLTGAAQASTQVSEWPEKYKNLHDVLFADNELPEREGKRTDAFILIKDDQILLEKYARGYAADKKHIMWSVSKTVMALLYGVAMQENKLQLDDSICKSRPMGTPRHCDIKIKDVLQWSTGIQWVEEYERSNRPTKASVLAMLYGEGQADMVGFVLKQNLAFAPGERWLYSSGDSILAAHILETIYATPQKKLQQIYREKLFQPLGMTHSVWELDPAGNIGSAYYLYATARDIAQVGKVILGQGRMGGVQLIHPEFIKFMRTVPESFKKNRPAHDGRSVSGAHLWLNDPQGSDHKTPWAAPADTLVAQGHWGQNLIIFPTEKVIAVRLGDNRDRRIDLKSVVEAVAKTL